MSELTITALAILIIPIIIGFLFPLFSQVFNAGTLEFLRVGFSNLHELLGSQGTNLVMAMFLLIIFIGIVRFIFSFFGTDR